MLTNDLETIGFDRKEAKLYLALLELGEASIAQIADEAGLQRTTCYHLIESLTGKGWISITTRRNKRLYSAIEPQKIQRDLEEKQMLAEQLIPQLNSLVGFAKKKPTIKFFEGVAGMIEMLKDQLRYPRQEIPSWWVA
jgi:sugar-specific transcriptional regulator TrmB